MSPLAFALASVLAVAAPNGAAHEEPLVEHPRFRIEVPSNVLTDVPVSKIVIRAFDANGKPDPTYNEQPLITGIRLAVPQTDDAKLGPFHAGVLGTLDRSASRTKSLHLRARNRRGCRQSAFRPDWKSRARGRWLALAPALVAFLLCLWPRNFVLAMFVAVVCGTAILEQGNLFHAFVHTIDSFVLDGRFVGLERQPVSYHDAHRDAVFRLALFRPGGERRPLGSDRSARVGGPRPANKANCWPCSSGSPPSSTIMRMR